MPPRTPVAFFIFNRPDLTAQVFAAIRLQQPSTLLVVADGPRHAADEPLCAAARAVISGIDWPCNLLTNYSTSNLGCCQRVASGLDWVFQQVEEAIVLEDDCLPHPSFFEFCEELLARFRDDERVMMIGGANFQKAPHPPYSYYFSRYTHIWGWASWRRAWRHYDVDIGAWPEYRSRSLLPFAPDENRFWTQTFDAMLTHQIDTWDYQWQLANLAQNGLAVLPEVNLVSNLGFGAGATHTTARTSRANLPVHAMGQLVHPPLMAPDVAADRFTYQSVFAPRPVPLWRRAAGRIKRAAKAALRGGAT